MADETLICRDVAIAMRDGVSLSSDLFVGPGTAGAMPVVLIRTPYDRAMVSPRFDVRPFLDRDYAVIFQDVRGTGLSEGIIDPLMNEADDGVDTVAWLVAQPWCNGQVCTTGPSYMGGGQMQLAVRPVRGHDTGFVQVAAGNMFDQGMVYDNGMLALEPPHPGR